MINVISQHIENKDGVVYRVTVKNGEKSYKALGSSTEPKVLVPHTLVKDEDKVAQSESKEVQSEDKKLSEGEKVVLDPLDTFEGDKAKLETYGLTFGIDLNKRKSVANMYKDLEVHVNG